jgi:MinD-like ATPase involved in chromosome partitioning or flagellar assembly
VVKYADTGKDIWITKSEAKYNDYIIYDIPSGTDETVIPPVTP